jgi:hypothetical protein
MHNYHLFLLYSVRSNTVQRNAISSMYHNNMSRIRHMHAQAAAAMEKIKRNRSEYEDGEEDDHRPPPKMQKHQPPQHHIQDAPSNAGTAQIQVLECDDLMCCIMTVCNCTVWSPGAMYYITCAFCFVFWCSSWTRRARFDNCLW